MSRSLGASLPPQLTRLLDGAELPAKVGLTIQCCTVTEVGWPHLAMVSVGELLALNATTLRLALWETSSSVRALTLSGRCTLALVHDGAGYLVRCTARRRSDVQAPNGQSLAAFDLSVAEVIEDVAPYAVLTGGITYRLRDAPAVVARWETTIAWLRSLRAS